MKLSGYDSLFEGTNLIVGAYATSPSLLEWDSQKEGEYLSQICALPDIDGLELPYWGDGFCRYDESIVLRQIRPKWSNVVTAIPAIMSRVSADSSFGLASNSELGRKRALDLMERIRQKVEETAKAYPNFQCNLVSLCSAPISELSANSKTKFKQSLQEIASWDWGEIQLVVEHCDEYQEDGSHQKGSMSLEDELIILKNIRDEKSSDRTIGVTINWARSAIESRDKRTPVEHIRTTKNSGLLRGLMFSGVSAKPSPYGVWMDTHAPPKELALEDSSGEGLLLDRRAMTRCISEVGDYSIDYIGIKIGAKPDDISIAERCRLNSESLEQLKKC